MLPTRLNLLPPEKISYLQRMIFVQFVRSTLETILLLLCVAGITLLAGQWILQGYFNDLTVNTIAVNNPQGESNLEIKEINASLRAADLIQKKYTLWTPVMKELGNSIPAGVTLSKIDINVRGGKLLVSGKADKRKDLFALQQSLEALPDIESISIPHSLLNEQENISFSLNIALK